MTVARRRSSKRHSYTKNVVALIMAIPDPWLDFDDPEDEDHLREIHRIYPEDHFARHPWRSARIWLGVGTDEDIVQWLAELRETAKATFWHGFTDGRPDPPERLALAEQWLADNGYGHLLTAPPPSGYIRNTNTARRIGLPKP